MKEPEGHHCVEYNDYRFCEADGEVWPCPTWKHWAKSKDYRIKQLEDAVQRLQLDAAGNRKELANLRESHRRLEMLVRHGVWPALREAGVGSIAEEVTRDVQDFTLAGSSRVHSVAGREDYTVTFTGRNSKWVNGELSETWYP